MKIKNVKNLANIIAQLFIDIGNKLGIGDVAPVALSGNYNDLVNKPDLSVLEEVLVFPTLNDFPATGESQKVYIAEDTGYMYRWSGSEYVQLTDQTAIWGNISGNLTNQTDLMTLLATKQIKLLIYNQQEVNAKPEANKIRFYQFLKASYNTSTEEIEVKVDEDKLAQFNSPDLIDINGQFFIAGEEDKIRIGTPDGKTEQKTLSELFEGATEELSPLMFHIVDGKLELKVPEDEIIVGDLLHRGRTKKIGQALENISTETGIMFGIGVDGKVQIVGNPDEIIRFNANGEAESQPLVSGPNKVPATDENGNPIEAELIQVIDILRTDPQILQGAVEGQLDTFNLAGIASGVKGGYQIEGIYARKHTPNDITFSIGSFPNGKDIVRDYTLLSTQRKSLPLGEVFFHNSTETLLYLTVESGSADTLELSFKVSKIV